MLQLEVNKIVDIVRLSKLFIWLDYHFRTENGNFQFFLEILPGQIIITQIYICHSALNDTGNDWSWYLNFVKLWQYKNAIIPYFVYYDKT